MPKVISRGLINQGNTCYLNSIIQCITHLFIFNNNNVDFTIEIDVKKDNPLLKEWLLLQENIIKDSNEPLNILAFIEQFMVCISNSNYDFYSFNQNDVSEFITLLFEFIHTSIKSKKNMTIEGTPQNELDNIAIQSMNNWIQFFNNDYSYIIKSSYSQLLIKTECRLCNYKTYNHDPIQILTLELKNNDDLEDILHEYIKPSILDRHNEWKCDKCHKINTPIRHTVFWNLSNIVIIQLKLYSNNLQKINTKIRFPLNLDMSKYTINYNDNNTNYKLYGICCQSGHLQGGHYYSICYNKYDNKWRRYNDSQVSEINTSEVLSESPYCLFYMVN
jgi:ubiquitin carboxyl-terminal hydrolase 8